MYPANFLNRGSDLVPVQEQDAFTYIIHSILEALLLSSGILHKRMIQMELN